MHVDLAINTHMYMHVYTWVVAFDCHIRRMVTVTTIELHFRTVDQFSVTIITDDWSNVYNTFPRTKLYSWKWITIWKQYTYSCKVNRVIRLNKNQRVIMVYISCHLTQCWEPKLSANNTSCSCSQYLLTNSAPQSIITQFNYSFWWIRAPYQPYSTYTITLIYRNNNSGNSLNALKRIKRQP